MQFSLPSLFLRSAVEASLDMKKFHMERNNYLPLKYHAICNLESQGRRFLCFNENDSDLSSCMDVSRATRQQQGSILRVKNRVGQIPVVAVLDAKNKNQCCRSWNFMPDPGSKRSRIQNKFCYCKILQKIAV
jgi:hypothetical protein